MDTSAMDVLPEAEKDAPVAVTQFRMKEKENLSRVKVDDAFMKRFREYKSMPWSFDPIVNWLQQHEPKAWASYLQTKEALEKATKDAEDHRQAHPGVTFSERDAREYADLESAIDDLSDFEDIVNRSPMHVASINDDEVKRARTLYTDVLLQKGSQISSYELKFRVRETFHSYYRDETSEVTDALKAILDTRRQALNAVRDRIEASEVCKEHKRLLDVKSECNNEHELSMSKIANCAHRARFHLIMDLPVADFTVEVGKIIVTEPK